MRPVPLADRVVEVIADLGKSVKPRYRYGSGLIVRGHAVLTAAHVVAEAEKVQVRDPDKNLYPASVNPSFIGDSGGPGPDLALVEIDDETLDLPPLGLARVDRDSPAADPVERCHAIGYPWFAETPSPTAVRETVDAIGVVPALSRLAGGLLSVQVTVELPRPLPPEKVSLAESEWSGMSGAPVVAAGLLLGVVIEHAPREGPSAITAVPLTALEHDPAHPNWGPGVQDPAAWWSRLGVAGIEELKRLPAPPEHAQAASMAEAPERARFDWLFAAHALFAGRDEELGRLDRFLEQTGGYLFVSAPSGLGKTAILVNWVRNLEGRGYGLAYAFVNRLAGHADEEVIFRALCQQLAAIHGESGLLPSGTGELRALYLRLLTTAPGAGQRIAVVLDGLDEAVGWEPKPDLFPAQLPDGVAIVFSAREIAGRDWLDSLGFRGRPIEQLRLETLGPTEIGKILATQGDALPQWVRTPQVAGEVHAVSGGDPLYVRMLVDDLEPDREGRVLISSLEELRAQPSGLDDYFDDWWGQILEARKERPELGNAVRDLLGYLLVAKGPLGREELSELSDQDALDDWTVDDALALVRRQIIGDPETGIALAHPRFQSYLAEKRLGESVQREYEKRLLGFCARWQEQPSNYALRHYAAHLADGDQSDELFALARDDQFAAAQQHSLPTEPGLPVRDTELAFRAAAEADDAPGMAEFALRKALKVAAIQSSYTPIEALRTVGLSAAWAVADLYDHDRRTRFHLLVAWELKDDGRTDEARATLKRLSRTSAMPLEFGDDLPILFDAAEEIDVGLVEALENSAPDTQGGPAARALRRAQAQTRAGELDAALDSAETIGDPSARADALRGLALAQAQADATDRARASFAAAQAATEAIDDESERMEALSRLAVAQAQVGEFAAAQQTAEGIADAWFRAEARTGLAVAQAKAGEFAAAKQTAEAIKDDNRRMEALSGLAVALAQAGEFAAAQQTAERIVDAWFRMQALSGLAVAQARAGDAKAAHANFAAARATADGVVDAGSRAEALSGLAVAQTRAGDVKGAQASFAVAKKATEAINSYDDEPSPFTILAVAQSEAGKFAAAQQTVEAIHDRDSRALALVKLGGTQAQEGAAEAARASFVAAQREAEAVDDYRGVNWGDSERASSSRAEVLTALAVALAEAGDFAAAQATAEAVRDYDKRVEALTQLAIAEAQAGATAAARTSFAAAQATDANDHNSRRVEALSWLAVAQAQAGDAELAQASFAAAQRAAKGIDDDSRRFAVLFKLAVAQAQAGATEGAQASFAGAKAAVETFPDWDQPKAFAKLAVAQAQVGEFAAAQATAEAIDVEEDRAEALTKLASAQAHAGDSEAARASFAAAQATAEAIALDRENVFGGPAITQAKKALESVSASLSETVDRAELKQVIGACTDYVDLAPRICALLARAYPDQAAGLVARVQPLLSSA